MTVERVRAGGLLVRTEGSSADCGLQTSQVCSQDGAEHVHNVSDQDWQLWGDGVDHREDTRVHQEEDDWRGEDVEEGRIFFSERERSHRAVETETTPADGGGEESQGNRRSLASH